MTPRHRLATLAAISASALAHAAPLYSNASADPYLPALVPSATSLSGIPGTWSEVPREGTASNRHAGFAVHALNESEGYWLADDFIIADAAGWRIRRVSLYAYALPTTASNPIIGAELSIWSGQPGSPGAAPIYAGLGASISAIEADQDRIFNSQQTPVTAPNLTRPLWRIDLDVGSLGLTQGTYWLVWQLRPADGVAALFAPAVTTPGQRSRPGWNAIQFRPGSFDEPMNWYPAIDEGKPLSAADLPQDFPFLIDGVIGADHCPADINHSGGVPDVDDLVAFFDFFNAGDPLADINQSGGIPDVDDLISFFEFFAAGC